MLKVTPFLWFDTQAQEAAKFYVSLFPNSKVTSANPMMATFELNGQTVYAINGGPLYKFTEAFSFFVDCDTQEEVDQLWSKLTADGGEESQCGWLKDKFGLSWQIIPTLLSKYLSDPDRAKADRVMQVMLKMKKIDIALLQKAYDQS